MSEQKTFESPYGYQLIVPIVDGSTEIATLDLEEPTLDDMERLSDNTKKHGAIRAFTIMLADHTKLPVSTVKKLKSRDFNAIQEYYDYFLSEAKSTT